MSRAWVVVDYPAGVTGLSKSAAMRELTYGPKLSLYRPWAEHGHVAPITSTPWGYVHVHGEWGADPVWELVGFYSADELAWGLKLLFERDHDWHLLDVDGYLNDHECHGVFWWLPTDPQMLRLRLGVNR